MKILYVVNSTVERGGANKSLLSLMSGAQCAGHVCYVLCPNKHGIYMTLPSKGIKTICIPYRPHSYPFWDTFKDILLFLVRLFARIVLNAIAVLRLVRFCKREGIHLIHTNVSIIKVGYYASRLLGLPHIWHVREYGDTDFREKYFPTWKCFHRDLQNNLTTICITRGVQLHHGLNGNNSQVIYNGFDCSINEQPNSDRGYFLFAGRIEPAKNPEIILRAYALACKEKNLLPLVMIGNAPKESYLSEMTSLARELGIEDRVSWKKEQSDIHFWMQNAKAVIISSTSEGFGRVMPEAMLAGTVCLAFDACGSKEQMDNGEQMTGKEIAIRFNSIDSLRDALLQVSTPDFPYKEMVERAKLVVLNLYSKESYVSSVLKIYKQYENRF